MELNRTTLLSKIFIVSDKTKNSLKIKKLLEKKVKVSALPSAKLIIVLGGDGFMLESLKKFYKFKKPFYGLNTGNYGFLMNKLSIDNFLKN